MNSFIDTFKEMESSLAIVTETWLKSGEGLEDDLDDLLHGAGIGLITLNRRAGSRGVAHGGVAIGYRAAVMDAKEIAIDNPKKFEVLPTIATLAGQARKLIVIGAYVPPGYTARRGKDCLMFISDLVVQFLSLIHI